jgi:DNA helicase-2/ATP-dependent DNA helicase PcrA
LLLDSLRRDRMTEWVVPVPGSLSVTAVMALSKDEDAFAGSLRRPMPRRPVLAARRGSALHAWIESKFGEQPLLPHDDLPGARDAEIDSDSELDAMKDVFNRSPYATREPYAIEAPVTAVFAGTVVEGRIDAVFRDGDQWELVDWKTNRVQDADPLQLAVYRIAWAEAMNIPMESISASFFYLRTGDLVTPSDLPDRAEVERLL